MSNKSPNRGTGFRGIVGQLTESACKMFSIDIQPDDLKEPPPKQDNDVLTIVRMCEKDYKDAASTRQTWEREAITSIAFADGNQWARYREIANNLRQMRDTEDPFKQFMQVDYLSQCVTGTLTAVTATDPDVTIQPVTPRQVDVGAADEATDIMAHLDLRHGWGDLRDSAITDAITYGVGYIKHYWDPNEKAVGYRMVQARCLVCGGRGASGPFGASTQCPACQGSGFNLTQEAYIARMGEVQRCYIPGIEVYIDSEARSWKDARYIYHVKRRSLDYIRDHYPFNGKWVPPNASDSWQGSVDVQLDGIAGATARGGDSSKNSAYVCERWEKPSDVYPNGRFIPTANGWLLRDPDDLDWPYDNTDMFPFVPITMKKLNYSSYPIGRVRNAVGLQQNTNEIFSTSMDQMKEQIWTILINKNSKVHPDSFHNKQQMRQIIIDGTDTPQVMAPPPVGADRFEMLAWLKAAIQDQFGYHDVSQGKTGDAQSGIMLELQQQTDQTTNAPLLRAIERAAEDSATLCLALAAQFYREPRLVAVGQSDDPEKNQIQTHDFKNMQAGGQVRVHVVPGSAIGRSPASREQKLLALAQAHMFDPAQLPQTIVILKLMQLSRDDSFIRELIEVSQQQMAQLAQQANAPAQAMQAKAAADAQTLQTKQQGDQALQTLKNQGQIANTQQEWIARGEVVDQEQQYELEQSEQDKRNPPVSIALKGTMGAQGTIAAEEAVGLQDADTPQSIATENAQQTASQVAVKATAPPQQEKPTKPASMEGAKK